MKTSYVAALAVGAAVLAAFLAYPAFASSTTSTSTATSSSAGPGPFQGPIGHAVGHAMRFFGGRGGGGPMRSPAVNFSTGQVITLTSTKGSYFVVGTQGKTNGTASGTITLTVDGRLTAGYTLTFAGSVTVAGSTYTVSSGSGIMGPGGASVQGEGATSPSGSFILNGSARGDFTGTTTATVSLDFSNGTTEYAVSLTCTISG